MTLQQSEGRPLPGGQNDTSHGLTFVQVGVGEAAPQLFDDVDGLQVPGALQPHDGVDGQLGEVVFVVSQQLGGQGGPGNVQQVLLKTGWVVATATGGRRRQRKNKYKNGGFGATDAFLP